MFHLNIHFCSFDVILTVSGYACSVSHYVTAINIVEYGISGYACLLSSERPSLVVALALDLKS